MLLSVRIKLTLSVKVVEYSYAYQSGYHFDGVSFVNITECSSSNSVVAGCGSLNYANPMNSQALMNVILLLLRMKTVAMDLASI